MTPHPAAGRRHLGVHEGRQDRRLDALAGVAGVFFIGDIHGKIMTDTQPMKMAERVGLVAAVLALAFLAWTVGVRSNAASVTLSVLAAVALVAALAANRMNREGWAFVGTAVTIALAVIALFTALHPDVMPSTINPAYSLTTSNASSSAYTLRIMTWVAAVFTPIVRCYQAWTCWVFRKRIGTADIAPA